MMTLPPMTRGEYNAFLLGWTDRKKNAPRPPAYKKTLTWWRGYQAAGSGQPLERFLNCKIIDATSKQRQEAYQ